MSANASPAEIILACFCVSIAAMILTGIGCSINNHIRRRRGLRGLWDSPPNRRALGRRTLSRASRRREKGLSAYEVEIYCPEIIYKGPLEPPLLFWEEDDQVFTPTQVEEKYMFDPPPPVATKSNHLVSEDKAVVASKQEKPNSGGWSEDDAETTSALPQHVNCYFLGQHILPDGVCAVCLETVEKDCHLRLLPCGHAFHVQCITHWLSYGTRCPLCNEMVRLSDRNRTRSGSHQRLHSVQVTQNNDSSSSPRTLPLFMAVSSTTTRQMNEERMESIQEHKTISKEVVMQSFERIRLRLYERYLERQQQKTQSPVEESLNEVVVHEETL